MKPTQPVSLTGMSSPFTPLQSELILVGAGVFVLLSCWQVLRALRSSRRGTAPMRLAPLALVILSLCCAFEAVMVVAALPFFVRHIEWMLIPPIIGFLAVAFASNYDEQHKVTTGTEGPSRADLLRNHLAAALKSEDPWSPPGRKSPLIGHLKSLARLYVGSEQLQIISRYNLDQARSRIRQLEEAGEVWILEKSRNKLTVGSTRVRGNILPLFTGTLIEHDGKAVLDGRIEIDVGIVVVLGVFSVIFLVALPLRLFFNPSLELSDLGFGMLGMLFWIGMLEFGYHINKESPAIITRNLQRALQE